MLTFVRRPPVVLAIFVAIVMAWSVFLTHVVEHLKQRPAADVVFLVALVVATLSLLTAAVFWLAPSPRTPPVPPEEYEAEPDAPDDLHALELDLGGVADYWANDAALTEPTHLMPGVGHFTPWWGAEPPPAVAAPMRAIGLSVVHEDPEVTEAIATQVVATQVLDEPPPAAPPPLGQLDDRYLQGYVAGSLDLAERKDED